MIRNNNHETIILCQISTIRYIMIIIGVLQSKAIIIAIWIYRIVIIWLYRIVSQYLVFIIIVSNFDNLNSKSSYCFLMINFENYCIISIFDILFLNLTYQILMFCLKIIVWNRILISNSDIFLSKLSHLIEFS